MDSVECALAIVEMGIATKLGSFDWFAFQCFENWHKQVSGYEMWPVEG